MRHLRVVFLFLLEVVFLLLLERWVMVVVLWEQDELLL